MSVLVLADCMKKGRRLGNPLGGEGPHTTCGLRWRPREAFHCERSSRCNRGSLRGRKIGRRNMQEAPQSCPKQSRGRWKYEKVAEEGADGRRVTGQDPIIEEEGGEVDRIRRGRSGQTTCLEDDGVGGQCEECGPQWIALLNALSAVDGAVADDKRGGRPVAEGHGAISVKDSRTACRTAERSTQLAFLMSMRTMTLSLCRFIYCLAA